MIFTKKNATINLLVIFLVVCVFFPGDPFHIKLISFFLILALNISIVLKELKKNDYLMFFGVLFPIILIFQTFFVSHNLGSAISGAYPATLILILPVVRHYDIKYDKYLLRIVGGSVLLIVLIVLIDFIGVVDINSPWFMRNAFYDYGMGIMGKSPMYSFYYKVFLKSSPLIVLLINDSLKKKKIIITALSILAMLFTGTRANVLLCVIFVLYVLAFNYEKKGKEKVIVTFLVVSILMFCFPLIYEYINEIMSSKGAIASDEIRDGQMRSFIEIFSDPFNLIFGMGLGSPFFNYGRNAYTTTAEFSYLELMRQIGVPLFVVFMYFVLKPLTSSISKQDKMTYICYLIIAFTNPLLFSSTAYLLYIFVYNNTIELKQ
ncbi:O-antigen ligase family protein [Ruminococcus flavefaciens]|uniref:Predicted membrane protein n=1 Tax=Ruminococcus flavefaciens TaxID=1265 RepID=A0A1M7G9S1_RUMFL|nr:O-antigen ligase family protein [Ruminococcus flavefaciens]SHM12991.1 Predicted membrane protein [Ruminococcus flavefaciens]